MRQMRYPDGMVRITKNCNVVTQFISNMQGKRRHHALAMRAVQCKTTIPPPFLPSDHISLDSSP